MAMKPDRRDFLLTAATALGASPWLARGQEPAAATAVPGQDMSNLPPNWTGQEQIGMLLYPGMTALDFVGPQHMFASLMGATVHHVAKTLDPVVCESNLTIVPTTTLVECPRELDILFVPGGGEGTLEAMQDPEILDFLNDRGSRAKLVTSVCVGSLLLGAAGLLRGYQATSHWATLSVLPLAGAHPVEQRVVQDRNRITGAGVSAGLDLGLIILALLRDRNYAETTQLLAEYSPEPPFQAGSPRTASPDVTAMVDSMFVSYRQRARSAMPALSTRKGAA